MLISISEAAALIGVCCSTLRRWEMDGSYLPAIRTAGGHRGYCTEDITKTFFPERMHEKTTTITYARVSSHDQKEDLQRQIGRLQGYCEKQGFKNVVSLSDLGSGLNYKKKGLRHLITALCSGTVKRLEAIHNSVFPSCPGCKAAVGHLLVTGDPRRPLCGLGMTGFEEELAADVIEIITVFTSKLYGRRSHQNKRAA